MKCQQPGEVPRSRVTAGAPGYGSGVRQGATPGRRPSDQRHLRPPQLLPQLVSAEQVLEAKHHGSGNVLESSEAGVCN